MQLELLKGRVMSEIEILKAEEGPNVVLQYTPEEEKAFYDVCDDSGRIVCTGTIEASETKISVESIADGYYTIFIVDGGTLRKKRFKLS